jgi:hypothetical protein
MQIGWEPEGIVVYEPVGEYFFICEATAAAILVS